MAEEENTAQIMVSVAGVDESIQSLNAVADAANAAADAVGRAVDAISLFQARLVAMEGMPDPDLVMTDPDDVENMIKSALERGQADG